MCEKLSRRFVGDAAGAQRLGQRLDARREPVGSPLQTIVRHDNKLRGKSGRSFPRGVPWGAMRRILLSCAILAVLTLPAGASARAHAKSHPGYLVVQSAAGDGGVNGHAIITLIVHGFVLGSVSPQNQAQVDIYQLPSTGGQGAPTANGPDGVTRSTTKPWEHHVTGHRFRGTGFRFRAIGGYYRVVVRGSGVYLFTGGHGQVTLHGSSFDRKGDGTYAIDHRAPRSLPTRPLTREIGRG